MVDKNLLVQTFDNNSNNSEFKNINYWSFAFKPKQIKDLNKKHSAY